MLNSPIDLLHLKEKASKKGNSEPSHEVYLNYFSRHPGHLKFRYDHSDAKWVDIATIITTVTFTFNVGTGVYSLDSEDGDCLDDFVQNN